MATASRADSPKQYHEEGEPDYRHAGLDVFLSTAHAGAGLGSEAVRLLARHLVESAATIGS